VTARQPWSLATLLYKRLPLGKVLRRLALFSLNDRFLIGVTGVIFDKNNHILLLKHTYRRVPWSLPGGYLKTTELPKIGLAREIAEETGFQINVIRIISTHSNDRGHLDMSYFGEFKGGKFRPSAEVSDYMFVSVDRLPKLLTDQYEQIHEALRRKRAYDKDKKTRRKHEDTVRLGPYRVQE
jgi:8-oxo-dGTP diphosphatase